MSENDYIQEDTRLINLYSQSATEYLNGELKSDVLFNFKNILTEEPNIMHVTMGVVTAQIPVSYYTINEYNNILVTSEGTITITFGNYNSSSLITEMKARFLELGVTMVIIISRTTGRLTFTRVAGAFDFLFNGSTSLDILGFNPTINSSSMAGGGTNTLVAPFPLNLLGIQQLKINSSALGCYNSSSTSLGESNLVGVIQSTAPPFGMILYNNQNSYGILRSKRIGLVDIQILDENGNFVDFNNVDWTLTFQMTIFRRISLPDNSTTYLKPILKTLTTLQEVLANEPKSKLQEPEVEPEPEFIGNDDSNSLDIMTYNKLIPQPPPEEPIL